MPSTARQFHFIASTEGTGTAADGALAGRFARFAQRLADAGEDVHVWYLGVPTEPARERHGSLTVHRGDEWRWRAGSSDGRTDDGFNMATSPAPLASFLLREILLPHVRETGGGVVMLAEDTATVGAVLHLDWVLRWAGLRDRVVMMWNVNHPFGLDRVDWRTLQRAAYVTTTSPVIVTRLWGLGVQHLLIPDSLPADALVLSPETTDQEIRSRFEAWR
jgi:hypothetical protein